jgi:antimicrobial peptide system SdpB family protein
MISIARALIAFSTLLILLLNNDATVFGIGNGVELFTNNFGKLNLFFLFGVEKIWLSKMIAIIILLTSISGYLPRFTIIPQLWVHWSFINGSISIEGGDQVAYLVILFLTPIFLLDKRLNMWRDIGKNYTKFEMELIRFCLNLVKLQAMVIYFVASVGKYPVEQWLNGTSIYYWFIDPTFGLPDYLKTIVLPLLKNGWFIFVAGWSVLILELVLATGFIIKDKFKKYLFVGGVLLHFSIFLVHGLPNFMLSMIALLTVYLLVDFKKMESQI